MTQTRPAPLDARRAWRFPGFDLRCILTPRAALVGRASRRGTWPFGGRALQWVFAELTRDFHVCCARSTRHTPSPPTGGGRATARAGHHRRHLGRSGDLRAVGGWGGGGGDGGSESPRQHAQAPAAAARGRAAAA